MLSHVCGGRETPLTTLGVSRECRPSQIKRHPIWKRTEAKDQATPLLLPSYPLQCS